MDMQNTQPVTMHQLSLTPWSQAFTYAGLALAAILAAACKPEVWLAMSLAFHVTFLAFLWTFVNEEFGEELPKLKEGEFAFFCIISSSLGTILLFHTYVLIAQMLEKLGRGWFSGFIIKLVSVLIHELMVIGAAESVILQAVLCAHMCSFICFLRFYSGTDKAKIINVVTWGFVRYFFQFLIQGAYVSSLFFGITAFVGFMARAVEKLGSHTMGTNLSDSVHELAGQSEEQEG